MRIVDKEIKIPLQQVVNSLQAQVYWLDRDLVFLGCNEQQAKFLGLSSANEIVGKQMFDFQTKDNISLIQAAYDNSRQVISTQKTMIFEETTILSDGSKMVFLSEKSPIFDETGDVIGLLGIS